jgi:hypothetical protein
MGVGTTELALSQSMCRAAALLRKLAKRVMVTLISQKKKKIDLIVNFEDIGTRITYFRCNKFFFLFYLSKNVIEG